MPFDSVTDIQHLLLNCDGKVLPQQGEPMPAS